MKTKKYKEGVQVQVIRGTQDPDFDFEIGGWSGKINDIAEDEDGGGWLYCVVWDNATLEKMEEDLIMKCDKEDLDHTRTYLPENELEWLIHDEASETVLFIA